MKKQLLCLALLLPLTTLAQISQIADINPNGDSNPTELFVSSQNILYFRATNGTDGVELYNFDGSSITLVKNINATTNASGNSNPGLFIEFNNKIYFKASDGLTSDGYHLTELWVTDGTNSGTQMVADLNASSSGNPQDFFIYNNELYFEVNDGTSTQLWRLKDGTPQKVTNVNNGGWSSPTSPLVFSEGVFLKMTGTNGSNPYIFDGITATELADATAGNSFGLFNNEVYFEADSSNGEGDELWKTDGTISGTSSVKDILVGSGNSDPRDFMEFNGELYFAAEDSFGYNLWKTDGSNSGTIEVFNPNTTGDSAVGNLFTDGTNLYFTASNGTDGVELWKYDGTTATMLKDINSSGDANPGNFVSLNNKIYFTAEDGKSTEIDGTNVKLWVTDGTSENTTTVASLFETTEDPTDVNNLIVRNGKLIFTGVSANGNELFSLNTSTLSTDNHTTEIIQVYPNPATDFIKIPNHLKNSEYAIYTINGQIVEKGFIYTDEIKFNLNSGLYLLKIKTDISVLTKKILVE